MAHGSVDAADGPFFVGGLCASILPPPFTGIEHDPGLTHTRMGVIRGITAAGTSLAPLAGGVLGYPLKETGTRAEKAAATA